MYNYSLKQVVSGKKIDTWQTTFPVLSNPSSIVSLDLTGLYFQKSSCCFVMLKLMNLWLVLERVYRGADSYATTSLSDCVNTCHNKRSILVCCSKNVESFGILFVVVHNNDEHGGFFMPGLVEVANPPLCSPSNSTS